MKKLVGMAIIALFMIALLAGPVGAKPGGVKVDTGTPNFSDKNKEDNAITPSELSSVFVWINSPPGPTPDTNWRWILWDKGKGVGGTYFGSWTGPTDNYWYSNYITLPPLEPGSYTLAVYVNGATVGHDSFRVVTETV